MTRKMSMWAFAVSLSATGAMFGQAAPAQTPAPAAAPAPAPPPPSIFTVGKVDISGSVDGYYTLNFNHPQTGTNGLYNFNFDGNAASLNLAKITFEMAPAPVGFRLDIAGGKAMKWISATDPAPGAFRYMEQAYISFKPPKAKGLEVDFGKFVTAMGAEVIETKDNWNYSRSLLFAWAIPYYHMGVRMSVPVGKHFTGGIHVVNGWNNLWDNNTGKSVGFMGNVNVGKVTWSNNYMMGPEKTDTNKGYRHVYDSTVLVNANAKTSFYLNFDYGLDRRIGGGSDKWGGVAGAFRYQASSKVAVASRLEWFKDATGFNTGVPQNAREFTLTLEHKSTNWLLSRVEYRHDWSDKNYFDRGRGQMVYKNQPTLTIGMIAYFK